VKYIVILGATGNTGTYLTRYLLGQLDPRVYKVVGVGRRPEPSAYPAGASYLQGSITTAALFDKLPQRDVHAIVMLAGRLPASMEGYHPEQYLIENTLSALNVLEYARKVNANRLLYAQTIREIGMHLDTGKPLTSDLPRGFSLKGDHAVYVISKNAAVDLIDHYQQEHGITRFIFRLPTIYAYTRNEYFYVDGKKRMKGYRLFIRQAMAGDPIEMWGDPSRAHDVVYVKDLCQMFSNAITVETCGGVYNVGTGLPVTLEEQIHGIVDVFSLPGRRSEIIRRPEMPSARSYTFDIADARRDLGYEPRYGYLDYLRDFKREMERDTCDLR